MVNTRAIRRGTAARLGAIGRIRPQGWSPIVRPLLMGLLLLCVWQFCVSYFRIPPYVVPEPSDIGKSLIDDWPVLSKSLLVTLRLSIFALIVAVTSAVAIAVVFDESRFAEETFAPYAVIFQVTPTVALAPLIISWVNSFAVALLICAAIIAFFPILSNTMAGLKSIDRNLVDLFKIYRASRWQTLFYLKLPAALPYFLSGLRISGGLALVGAVVAEFVAGTAGQGSGLAYRILESGYQLQFPRMFAALALISATGVGLYFATSLISHLCLRRWHESAVRSE